MTDEQLSQLDAAARRATHGPLPDPWAAGCIALIALVRRQRAAMEAAAKALEPTALIMAGPPRAASKSDDFDRGCPLHKWQVRDMQQALALLRAELARAGGTGAAAEADSNGGSHAR